jgi:hypothetical protein
MSALPSLNHTDTRLPADDTFGEPPAARQPRRLRPAEVTAVAVLSRVVDILIVVWPGDVNDLDGEAIRVSTAPSILTPAPQRA